MYLTFASFWTRLTMSRTRSELTPLCIEMTMPDGITYALRPTHMQVMDLGDEIRIRFINDEGKVSQKV